MSCIRCGATRSQKVNVSLSGIGEYSADLCPRHLMQVDDLLQLIVGPGPVSERLKPAPVLKQVVAPGEPDSGGKAKAKKVAKAERKAAPIGDGGVKPDPAAVRAWARSNGIEVSRRGHIKRETVEAFIAWEKKEKPLFSAAT